MHGMCRWAGGWVGGEKTLEAEWARHSTKHWRWVGGRWVGGAWERGLAVHVGGGWQGRCERCSSQRGYVPACRVLTPWTLVFLLLVWMYISSTCVPWLPTNMSTCLPAASLAPLQLSKQLQRLQQRLSRSSLDPAGPTGSYDSPTAAAAAAGDAFKAGLDHTHPTYQRSAAAAAAADEGPFAAAGMHGPPDGVAVSKAYAAAAGGGGAEYGHVPARGWYLHACVVVAGLGVRWWLLNQTDPLQRKVMLVIIWPVSQYGLCRILHRAVLGVLRMGRRECVSTVDTV